MGCTFKPVINANTAQLAAQYISSRSQQLQRSHSATFKKDGEAFL